MRAVIPALAALLLLFCPAFGQSFPSSAVTVHRVWIEESTDATGGPVLTARVDASVRGLAGAVMRFETVVYREDGRPIRTVLPLREPWEPRNGALQAIWEGVNGHPDTRWNLSMPIPVAALEPSEAGPVRYLVVCTVRSGGAESSGRAVFALPPAVDISELEAVGPPTLPGESGAFSGSDVPPLTPEEQREAEALLGHPLWPEEGVEGSRDLPAHGPPHGSEDTGITRNTGLLRDILARLQAVLREFRGFSAEAPPPAERLRVLGGELFDAGGAVVSLLDQEGRMTLTRFGTLEEVELLAAIDETHERAAERFSEMVRSRAPASSSETERTRTESLLEKTGREVVEQQVVRFIERKGLGDLLAQDGRSILGRRVTKRLQLDLAGFLDRKSREIAGMPLGGFRSMAAAMRLQARRGIEELVGRLVVEFTGNRLVLRLAQRIVVDWAGEKLWPHLREAFRPKTRLSRRVEISARTMVAACDSLNAVAGGRDPRDVPLSEVASALDRANGTLWAARYLKRDLERAGTAEQRDTLAAAERILNRCIQRVSHQYLVLDAGRWEEILDRVDRIAGIHDDVGNLLAEIAPACDHHITNPPAGVPLRAGSYHRQILTLFPWFDDRITGLAPGTEPGLKQARVVINGRPYRLLAMLRPGETEIRFRGYLPMLPGRNEVILSLPGLPCQGEVRSVYEFPGGDRPEFRERIREVFRSVQGVQETIQTGTPSERSQALWSFGRALIEIGQINAEAGFFQDSSRSAMEAMKWIENANLPDQTGADFARCYELLARCALASDDRERYLELRREEIRRLAMQVQWHRSHGVGLGIALADLAKAALGAADMGLVLGFEPERVRPFVDTGIAALKERLAPRGTPLEPSDLENYPSLRAVFFQW